jgi:hypothetical protein
MEARRASLLAVEAVRHEIVSQESPAGRHIDVRSRHGHGIFPIRESDCLIVDRC